MPSLNFNTDRSLSFDGLNDHIRASDSPELNPSSWTLSAWIKTSQAGLGRVINKPNTNSGDNSRFLLFINGGKAETTFNNEAGVDELAAGTTTINDSQWHHIAGVFDAAGASLTIYVDGVADATVATTITPRSSTGDVFIGQFSDGFGQFYSGLLEGPRIYGRALSSTEIGPPGRRQPAPDLHRHHNASGRPGCQRQPVSECRNPGCLRQQLRHQRGQVLVRQRRRAHPS